MKIIFKRFLLSLSLIIILISSLGLVSASDNSDFIIDMTNDIDGDILSDNLNSENMLSESVISDNSESSYSDLSSSSSESNENNLISSDGGHDFKDVQHLIDKANEDDTIILSGDYSGDSKIVVNKTLKIEGDGSGATLDGRFLTKILEINSSRVVIKNIKFINSLDMGVNIQSNNVIIDNCSFENSINGELGSALSCYGDNVKILNSKFLNNIANKSSCHHTDGPAIYLIANNALIDNCTFINNTGYNFETASSGGAIWLKGQDCTVSNSKFINNSATSKFAWTLHSEEQTYLANGYGGAIYWVGNKGKIINCSFEHCISHAYAGALYFKAADGCSIINSNFTNNFAVGDAGAIYLGQNVFNFEINNSKFEENVALGLKGVIIQYDAFGGAIYSSKFVEDVLISNSSFLNNYGDNTIHYLGSNLQVTNSILDNPKYIGNDTLEDFLRVINDSTLEDTTLKITDFALYSLNDFSGAVVFGNGSLNNNFWGLNINSSDEFKEMKMIKLNDEFIAPENWINLNFAGLKFLTARDTYEYAFRFVLNDDSDVEIPLPDYMIKLENNIPKNQIDSSELFLRENVAKINYNFSEKGIDSLIIRNKYGKSLDSMTIICGPVFVEDSGNDTEDIQNAINGAGDGSVIVLSDKNYSVDTININKDISIYSEGLANVSSSDSSNALFNIVSKENNPNLTKVEINGLNCIVKNGDIMVLAKAINDSNEDLIDIPNIVITNNNLVKSSDDVVGESLTVLKLSTERAILATTGNISIINNDLIDGINPFIFDITSVVNGSDVNVINGSIINSTNSNSSNNSNGRKPIIKGKSIIICKNMNTTTVYSKDGKIGKYFTIRLTDSKSKTLANKKLIINFNGKNYYKTTDKNGYVKIQINLAKKGTYAIVCCFLGDDKYNASFKAAKIKVSPVKAKLKVVNKKFKVKSKKKILTAKFLSPKGKAVKGKKISFRINGKTYTAKTNSKGIASVKVKLNKRKTYKFTAKFAGDSTFKAISLNRKVVVK